MQLTLDVWVNFDESIDSQGLPQTLLIHNLVMSTLFGLELFVSVECTKCQSLENRQ